MSEDAWSSRVRGALTDVAGRVLTVEVDGRRTLPEICVDGFADEDLETVRRAFGDLLGMRVGVLRHVARKVDRDARRLDVVYALEPLGPTSDAHQVRPTLGGVFGHPPPATSVPRNRVRVGHESVPTSRQSTHSRASGFAWTDASALDDDVAAIVQERPVPPERAPWAQAGWLGEASAWIESSLARLGRAPTGAVEQVRTWALSSVLRVPTEEGVVYFKAPAALPLFVDEGRVLQGLAALHPREVPRPLAVDRERRWLLLDDVGPMIGWDAPVDEREHVLTVFGSLQAASTSQLDALLAMGCVDRRPAWLARELPALLADGDALAGLEDSEIARLRALEPTLVALCRGLAAGPVPDGLVHGDLHLDNVARDGDRYVFLDWTDAGVTHPFLDLIDVHREEDADARDRLRDAYLRVWTEAAPWPELLRLWDVARPISFLNQAVSYRYILANVEPGSAPELEWAIPHWLRLVLECDLEGLA